MDAGQLREVLDFAETIAREAGALTLKYFTSKVGYEMKSDHSPVTIADRKSEEHLRKRIERQFPTHGILGEEFGEVTGTAPARWIIDPIDGTYSFICRVPMYTVLVGLEWEGRMVAGVIHCPALDETVAAASGLGCRYNGAPARVSEVGDLSQARLLHAGPKLMAQYNRRAAFDRLRDAVYAERGWCDGYAHMLVATGRAEIMLDPILAIWDLAALVPVIQEAGGAITTWSGETDHRAPEAIATNGRLHDAVLREIARRDTTGR